MRCGGQQKHNRIWTRLWNPELRASKHVFGFEILCYGAPSFNARSLRIPKGSLPWLKSPAVCPALSSLHPLPPPQMWGQPLHILALVSFNRVNTWPQTAPPSGMPGFSQVWDEKGELAVVAEATPSCSSSFTAMARCHQGFPQELHTSKSAATSCPSPRPHWGSGEWCQAPGGPIATEWAQQPCPREGLTPPPRSHPSSWCGRARRFPSLFAFRVFIISHAARSCSHSFLPLRPVLLDLSPLHFSLLGAMPYLLHDSKPRPPPLPKEARVTHSSGKGYQELKQECLRSGCLFEDPDFPANNASLFFSEKPPIPFLWKRPGVSIPCPLTPLFLEIAAASSSEMWWLLGVLFEVLSSRQGAELEGFAHHSCMFLAYNCREVWKGRDTVIV